ncbi:hypothetical protein FE257_009771 [Aspergillus nanangensis]|uniref:Proteinase inhibitor, propeptide n=1 Tax=Aspergillus nanangensis TaxID=2582783 RepID=A0AAD4CK39_ASPNN|nr:hypothetical protein FE257_009771 [Aspergillus nanangensis]
MKLSAALLLVALPAALANAIVVTYPSDTPDSVVEDAIQSIEKAGGHITHIFELLKGFSAVDVTEDALGEVSTQTANHHGTVEKDQEYTTQEIA